MSEEIINPAVENAEEIEEQVIVKPANKKSNASVDNDKFDWDAFENDGFNAEEKAANEQPQKTKRLTSLMSRGVRRKKYR